MQSRLPPLLALPSLLGVLREATGNNTAGFFCLSLAAAYALALLSKLQPPGELEVQAGDGLAKAESRG